MTNFYKISATIQIFIASILLFWPLVVADDQTKSTRNSSAEGFVLHGLPLGAPILYDYVFAASDKINTTPLFAVINGKQNAGTKKQTTEMALGRGTHRRKQNYRYYQMHKSTWSSTKHERKFRPTFHGDNLDRNIKNTFPQDSYKIGENAIDRPNRFVYSNFSPKWRIDFRKLVKTIILTFNKIIKKIEKKISNKNKINTKPQC